MKLTLEQIRTITQGAERITEGNDGIRFFRFREAERKVYPQSEHFDGITAATAGIQLEFTTDATDLYMQVAISKATNRSFFCHDIFVDGKLIGYIRNFPDGIEDSKYSHEEFPLGQFTGNFSLGEGIKTIRIVFPWSVISVLEELSLKNASFITPVKPAKTILMYGDSITQGYDSLNPSQCYSLRLARWLNAEATIKAIGGEMFLPALAEQVKTPAPDYITVAYGTNDWTRLKDMGIFVSNCHGFIETISRNYPTSKIFVISPIFRTDREKTEDVICPFAQIEQTIEAAAKPLPNVTFLSGRELIPQNDLLLADRWVHPNHRGFDHYFTNLQKALPI